MAQNRNNFFGVGIVPASSTTNTTPGDLEYLSSDGKLHIQGASVNDSIVQETLAATLTNKSISGATNTFTAIPNTAFTNSSITINGSTIALGGTATITATAANALTIGTGLTGTSYNGSSAVTVAIDATVATLTGTQTLTNKTLTAPTINAGLFDSITATPATNLVVSSGGNISINPATFTQIGNIKITSSTINVASGDMTIQGIASTNVNIGAFSVGYVNLQRNGTTWVRVGSNTLDLLQTTELRAYDNTTTNYVGIKGATSIATSYTITLPAAAPATGNVLSYSGTSYVWSAPAATGITALTGDVTASGSGSVAATVASVGGKSATLVANAATAVAAAVTIKTPNTLVMRDGSGSADFNAVRFNNTTTPLNLYATTVNTAYDINLPANPPTAGQVLTATTGGITSAYDWSTPSAGGGASVNATVDSFSGTGAQTVFTLSIDPINKNNTNINISGVTQQKSTYSITGTSLTFSTPPPVGTSNIEVVSLTAAVANSGQYTSSVQTSLVAGATLTTSLVAGLQAIEVAGASAAVTLSTTPFGISASVDKTVIRLIGRSSTNTVTITNNDIAFGTVVNGTATLSLYNSIEFMYVSSVSRWIEVSRNF